MINLVLTTDKLDLISGAAVTLDVHASWVDVTGTPQVATPGKTNTAITTATTTDIVAAPGASTFRNVKTINVRNKHATLSCDVTIRFNANGTAFELHKVTLRAGEVLEYIEGIGWFVVPVATSPQLRTAKLGSDQSNSTTTLTELTGMSLTTGLGTFTFKYSILYQAAATTTGVRFSVNHTGTVTAFVANETFLGAATLASDAAPDQDVVTAASGLVQGFAARAKATTGWGTTVSVDTANADMLAIIEGLMIVTVDGDIELWHGSEVAAASTVKAGASLELVRTGD